MSFERLAEEIFFLFHRNVVKDGLNRVRTLLVAAYLNKATLDEVQNAQALLNRAIGQQFLEEVVSILVNHYFSEPLSDLLEKELN